MAKLGLHLRLCLLITFFTSSVFSRIPLEAPKTTILDVSASIHKAHEILSFDPSSSETLQQEQSISSIPSEISSSFTLELHSRDTLLKSKHNDYKTLTLDRLKRDSARVNSLNKRLDLAIHGVKKSDLKPLVVERETETDSKAENLQGPIISGMSQGSGEYFSRVGIGRPPKSLYMVLDTGSDVTWIQCAPCTDCYTQSDPIFEPGSSSTFSPLSCETKQCKSLDVSACRNGSCLYQVSYGDGSYTIGEFVTETLTFGNSAADKISIGCGHDNEGLFVGSAGLLALGGGSLSFPAQVKASSFSYCLVDRDSNRASTLQFGSGAEPTDAVNAPLSRNPQVDTFYYVGLTGMSVGGEKLNIPPSVFVVDQATGSGGIIIDSGTAVTRLRTEAYNTLRDAFVKGTQHLASTKGFALFDTCYDLSTKTTVTVPTVGFIFSGGKSLVLPAKNYLVPVDSNKTFCFAFAPTRTSLSIIGNLQQQGTRVSFNLAKSVFGFSPNKC